jgi:putative PIN family toxin of toxin-antitoxin system
VLRATADSNIYISGLLSRQGNPFAFLELARAGKLRLAVSDAILDEVAEVLQRKFDWPQQDIVEVRRQIERFAQKVRPAVTLDVVREDPDDNHILECASAAGSDYIVSGDKDLLRLGRYDSIRIVRVAEFLELAQERSL